MSGTSFHSPVPVQVYLSEASVLSEFEIMESGPLTNAVIFKGNYFVPSSSLVEGNIVLPYTTLMDTLRVSFPDAAFASLTDEPTPELLSLASLLVEDFPSLSLSYVNYNKLAAAMKPSSTSGDILIGAQILADEHEIFIRPKLERKGRFDGTNYNFLPGDVLYFGGVVYNNTAKESLTSPGKAVSVYLQITFSVS